MAMVPCGMGFGQEGTWYRKIVNPDRWRYKLTSMDHAVPYDGKKFATYLKDMIMTELMGNVIFKSWWEDQSFAGSPMFGGFVEDIIRDAVDDLVATLRDAEVEDEYSL